MEMPFRGIRKNAMFAAMLATAMNLGEIFDEEVERNKFKSAKSGFTNSPFNKKKRNRRRSAIAFESRKRNRK
jgi:hypothetical protein